MYSLATKVASYSLEDAMRDTDYLINNTDDIPVKEIPIASISHSGKDKTKGFSEERLKNTDLKYPILVTKELWSIDGRHRILKALENNMKTINAKIIPDNRISKSLRKLLEDVK